jgi:hypothetical protein
MSKYPEVITPEVLEKQAHIPTSEILADIEDTLAEISSKTRHKRMLAMESETLESGIKEREAFVEFLEKLIRARESVTP